MNIHFVKMHGAGNDFIILDNRARLLPVDTLDMQRLADRQFGIGCDQIVIVEPSERAQAYMRIINADGSEVGSCGNASRCVGWLLHAENAQEQSAPITIETRDAIIIADVLDMETITIDMGKPRLGWQDIPLAHNCDTLHLPLQHGELSDPVGVSMGNPHAVFFVNEPYHLDLDTIGPALERNALFPERANISFARIESENHISLRVWERGAGATLACGTAACATLVAANRRGLTGRKAAIDLPGGSLIIEWRETNDHVLMTGPVAVSYIGTFASENYGIPTA